LTRTTNSANILGVISALCCERSMMAEDILFTNQVAEEYGMNAATLRYWRHANQGPASFTLGPRGRVVYRRSEVERWLAEQEQATRRGGGAA
jgi:predicted DNA-binding transcriptional regulator AlpA